MHIKTVRNRLTRYLVENDKNVHVDLISVLIENLSKLNTDVYGTKIRINLKKKLNKITLCFGNVKSGENFERFMFWSNVTFFN